MNTIKTLIISAVLLIAATINANAQNEFYQKYSEKKDVTKVYISKTLFSLMNAQDGMNVNYGNSSNRLDISKVVKNLDGMYILTTRNQSLAKEMDADFKNLLQKYKLELLMEVNDNEDEVKMYVTRDGQEITHFFMHSHESDGELVIIYLEGRVSEEDLIRGMKSSMN